MRKQKAEPEQKPHPKVHFLRYVQRFSLADKIDAVSVKACADHLFLQPDTVRAMIRGARNVSERVADQIQADTRGKITRQMLRPWVGLARGSK